MLTVQGMALAGDTENPRQINQVNVAGIPPEFWDFAPDTAVSLGSYEAVLNENLAKAIGAGVGDRVTVRILKPGILPRDAPLASRAETASIRALCTVKAVLPDSGLGRFSLTPAQVAPYNAFVDLRWLQEQLGLEGRINLALVGEGIGHAELEGALGKAWRPE